jgi:hypothetical protein
MDNLMFFETIDRVVKHMLGVKNQEVAALPCCQDF